MSIMQLNVERFSVTSKKPFQDVLAGVEGQIGHPEMRDFASDLATSKSDDELQAIVNAAVGATDLMEFMRFDQGQVLRRELGEKAPQVVRLVVGNPLTMRKMVKLVPDAGSYAPVTILIDERPDGVHLSYDKMTSLLAPYGNQQALKVAEALDSTVEAILTTAAR